MTGQHPSRGCSFRGQALSNPIFLGIDTGGTYTDAVLFSETRGVVAKAKALTSHDDLATGIAAAADAVIAQSGIEAASIALVSLSTTLATNALVEGRGGQVALVAIGFEPADLERAGLLEALSGAPVYRLPGGHDVHGKPRTLDLSALQAALPTLAEEAEAIAVAGYFAVRNPEHEIAVRALIREATSLPVTCSHELSSKLGGPKRALTTLLNARLIGMIDRLISASTAFLAARGITAPLMVVRGDGALISASEARLRPIETILSGPAASLVGARHLTGLDRAIVADIGGTTTDIAILEDGRPRLDPEGALVGGFRTMVEAVAMQTHGLGGDSDVSILRDGIAAGILLGPRRVVPLSLAALSDGSDLVSALKRQLANDRPGRLDGRFAARTAMTPPRHLPDRDRSLLARFGHDFRPLDTVLVSASERSALDRLASQGLVRISAFTPTDAMHVLGRLSLWNSQAARLGGALLARQRDGRGDTLAADEAALAERVIATLTEISAHKVLEAGLSEDAARGFGPAFDPARTEAVRRALARPTSIVGFRLSLDRPLVGLGASAATYYPGIGALLGAEIVVPDHADVANAIGAVVGQITEMAEVLVTAPEPSVFLVSGGAQMELFDAEEPALRNARETASAIALAKAERAGASDPSLAVDEHISAPVIDGQRQFVEARIRAVSSGRPRLAVDPV